MVINHGYDLLLLFTKTQNKPKLDPWFCIHTRPQLELHEEGSWCEEQDKIIGNVDTLR